MSRDVSRLVYVGADGAVETATLDAEGPLSRAAITGAEADGASAAREGVSRHWPTWSPDGRRIAYSCVAPEGAQRQSLHVANLDDGSVSTVYASPVAATIAPNVPHYTYWSPDSRHIAFLAVTLEGMALFVANSEGQTTARRIVIGAPIYWSWAPEGSKLLLHVADRLFLVELEDPIEVESLADLSLGYRSPAWSPDSRHAAFVVSSSGGESTLTIADSFGGTRTLTARFSGLAAFQWSPLGSLLAYTVAPDPSALLYRDVHLLDAVTGSRRTVIRDQLLAFLWSPDGERLAYLTASGPSGELVWYVVGLDGERLMTSPRFFPSSEFAIAVTYFDQYAQSHRLWSADGRWLLLAGHTTTNGRLAADLHVPDHLTAVATDSALAPVHLATASIGFWSPV